MKRWLLIFLLIVAAAAVQASSEGIPGTAPAGYPGKPVTTVISAGGDTADQFGVPLAATVATSGASQFARSESAPGKLKIRHTGNIVLSVPEHTVQGASKPQHKYPARYSEPAPFTRSADYYIYSLRRIII